MKDRIKQYLASGLKPADICTIVGCSPSYISQLVKEEGFMASVEEIMKNAPPTAEAVLDSKYESLEHTLVKQMTVAAMDADLGVLSKALDSVTRAKHAGALRKLPGMGQATAIQNIVTINVPARILQAPALTLNNSSEVVAIDGKPMAPLSAEGVRNLFTKLEESRREPDMKGVQNEPNRVQVAAGGPR